MRDIPGLVDGLIEVARAAAPLVGVSPQAVTVAEKVVEVIDHAVQSLSAGEAGNIETMIAERDALEKRVNEHVDHTAAALRGG